MQNINKYKKVTTKILNLNTPNKNNRSYSKDCVQKMVGTFPIMSSPTDGRDSYGSYPLDKIIGECTSFYNDAEDALYVNGTIIKDFPSNYYLVPCGTGDVDDKGNISNYCFYAFALSDTTAFKGSTISIVNKK